jgi:hypothetical protein
VGGFYRPGFDTGVHGASSSHARCEFHNRPVVGGAGLRFAIVYQESADGIRHA